MQKPRKSFRMGITAWLAVAALTALALLLGLQFFPQRFLQADYARQAWWGGVAKRSLRVNDHVWSFYQGGEGPVLVLVHGLAGSKENWLPTLRPLTRTHRVIVPDLPGWGESTRLSNQDYGIVAQQTRLRDFLQALDLQDVHLVGHSMGGHIAGLMAARHPEPLRRLSLVDNAGIRFEPNAFAQQVMAGANPFNVNNREQFDAFMHLMFEQQPFVPGRVKDVWIAHNIDSHAFHTRVVDQVGRGAEAFLLEAELAKIKIPLQAIWCRHDRALDVSVLDRMRQLRPDLPTHVIETCGHMPMMETPDQLSKLLQAFE